MYGSFAGSHQRGDNAFLRIAGFIRNHNVCFNPEEKMACSFKIMDLSRRQRKNCGIAELLCD